MTRTTIRARLLRIFSVAILIPSLTTAVVAVWMIRQQVIAQAQARVTSDLEAAREIYDTAGDSLRDKLRIHATRAILYGALETATRDRLPDEMSRVLRDEGLDYLALLDASGRVVHRAQRPEASGDSLAADPYVRRVMLSGLPVSGTAVLPRDRLALESDALAARAEMQLTPTAMARPSDRSRETSGLVLQAAAPVVTAEGKHVGVLVGGILLNRRYDIVDRIRTTVFKDELYQGQQVGTATVFQGDLRIATNVRLPDGSRAITTRASAEVADAVLGRNQTWRGRAFVVHDWYLSAYAPVHDLDGATIGMLYVGTLERPYTDSLWRNLYVQLGITAAGVLLVSWVSIAMANRISRPLRAMSEAARKVGEGDYSVRIDTASTDEIGYLARSFNRMTADLSKADAERREWGDRLERKVEERTQQLRAMQTQMVRAEKLAAVGKLAAGVAHEINNPMTGILTNSSLLLADLPPDDPRRADLKTIVDETMRCRRIVKGLLEFSRQSPPRKASIDLGRVVGDVLALVRNQALFKRIEVHLDTPAGLPRVMADEDQMRQVVLNVVLNAAEAMPDGGDLRIRARAGEDRSICVEIRDSGPGVPAELQERVFEPFFTTKKSGTGLGLSIVYGIVEQHRGSVTLGTAEEGGAAVTICLPVDSPPEGEAGGPAS